MAADENTLLDGSPDTMAFFKRRNLLSRRACSSCLVPLAVASILLLLYFLNKHNHRQSQLDLTSDTNIQRLHEPPVLGSTVLLNDAFVSHFGRGGGTSRPTTKRFVLGLNYWEQLTMATINMYRLICLGERWNASVVQPFTLDSRLYGLRNFKAGECLVVWMLIDVIVQ